jgi:hypothetical protein
MFFVFQQAVYRQSDQTHIDAKQIEQIIDKIAQTLSTETDESITNRFEIEQIAKKLKTAIVDCLQKREVVSIQIGEDTKNSEIYEDILIEFEDYLNADKESALNYELKKDVFDRASIVLWRNPQWSGEIVGQVPKNEYKRKITISMKSTHEDIAYFGVEAQTYINKIKNSQTQIRVALSTDKSGSMMDDEAGVYAASTRTVEAIDGDNVDIKPIDFGERGYAEYVDFTNSMLSENSWLLQDKDAKKHLIIAGDFEYLHRGSKLTLNKTHEQVWQEQIEKWTKICKDNNIAVHIIEFGENRFYFKSDTETSAAYRLLAHNTGGTTINLRGKSNDHLFDEDNKQKFIVDVLKMLAPVENRDQSMKVSDFENEVAKIQTIKQENFEYMKNVIYENSEEIENKAQKHDQTTEDKNKDVEFAKKLAWALAVQYGKNIFGVDYRAEKSPKIKNADEIIEGEDADCDEFCILYSVALEKYGIQRDNIKINLLDPRNGAGHANISLEINERKFLVDLTATKSPIIELKNNNLNSTLKQRYKNMFRNGFRIEQKDPEDYIRTALKNRQMKQQGES